jgi:hypothetical protein
MTLFRTQLPNAQPAFIELLAEMVGAERDAVRR